MLFGTHKNVRSTCFLGNTPRSVLSSFYDVHVEKNVHVEKKAEIVWLVFCVRGRVP